MQSNSSRPSGQQPPEIVLPAELQIEYVNLVRIAHSPAELVFDFAHLLPGSGAAQVSSRIIMSPIGAKMFQRALTENLSRYEATFGEISLPKGPTLADDLFHSISPSE
jgi:Protein of unknown function (DUF3467)